MSLFLILIMFFAIITNNVSAYESVSASVTGGVTYPFILPVEKINVVTVTATGADNAEYADVVFRDLNNNQVFRVLAKNNDATVFNSANVAVCIMTTEGAPNPTNVVVTVRRNTGGTYNASAVSEAGTYSCNNFNLIDSAKKEISSYTGSVTASGGSYTLSTTMNKGFYVRAYDLSNTAYLTSYNSTLNDTVVYEQYDNFRHFNMTTSPNGVYELTISKDGYTNDISNITWDSTNSQRIIGNLYVLPTLNLTFYDLYNNNQLTNVYTIFDGDNNYFEENITTGNYFNSEMVTSYYRIFPTVTGYSGNNYYINLSPSTEGIINAYLLETASSSAIEMLITDLSNIPIEDAQVSAYFRNGTNLKLVGIGRTSIIGKTSFNLDSSRTHTFIIEANSYSTKTFSYLPTEDVTIKLSSDNAVIYNNIFDTVSYYYSPSNTVILANDNSNFTLTVSDSNNQISSFGISSIYDNETVTGSSSGGIATLSLNTSGLIGERVLIYYNISLITGESYQTSQYYYVLQTNGGNTTGDQSLRNLNYPQQALTLIGVGLILVLALALAKAGLPSQFITILSVIVLGVLTWLGWFNEWLGYTTVIIVFLYLIFRGGIYE